MFYLEWMFQKDTHEVGIQDSGANFFRARCRFPDYRQEYEP